MGAVFYALYAWIGAPGRENPDRTIRVTAAEVNRLDAGWRARWNRPPTREELTGLVQDYIRQEALYRHAVAMGLDKNDMVVRRMLGQKLQTLTQNLLELSLSPTDQELEAYFAANIEQYRPPTLITFTQIFLNPDRRGDATLDDAEEVLTRLRALPEPTEGIDRLGDSFMLQSYYPGKTALDISKQFGQGFTESVFALSPREWHGPVLSGYGVHLVYVHGFHESVPPELNSVRERVQQDWVDEKRREFQDAYVEEILAGYEVVFEEVPAEAAQQPAGTGQGASE